MESETVDRTDLERHRIFQVQDKCEHTPDCLNLVDWEFTGNQVIQILRCNCGKTVTEVYRLSDTKVSDKKIYEVK